VGSIFGDESGLGVTDAFPDLGSSSNFLRASWGVGGVELFARGIDQQNNRHDWEQIYAIRCHVRVLDELISSLVRR
jgi:hypothetical protein